MKIPLRYFLITCLLLGAVGVPWGWKKWQSSGAEARERLAETQRLKAEFDRLLELPPLWDDEYARLDKVSKRLEQLTGASPWVADSPWLLMLLQWRRQRGEQFRSQSLPTSSQVAR